MPRYVVERTYTAGAGIPTGVQGAEFCRRVIELNEDCGVTWLQSYISQDGKKEFCLYDGPSPEAIRQTAVRNHLPVDCITQVRVLDPYFYE